MSVTCKLACYILTVKLEIDRCVIFPYHVYFCTLIYSHRLPSLITKKNHWDQIIYVGGVGFLCCALQRAFEMFVARQLKAFFHSTRIESHWVLRRIRPQIRWRRWISTFVRRIVIDYRSIGVACIRIKRIVERRHIRGAFSSFLVVRRVK